MAEVYEDLVEKAILICYTLPIRWCQKRRNR